MTHPESLVDSRSRIINYLRISITDRCNLRCVYCMPEDGVKLLPHREILTFEEIELIVKVAAGLGITKLRITGGEPLVRRGVADLIARLTAIEGITDVGLTTNGILLADFADALWEAGLRRINVSMDSLNPEKFRAITRGGDLGKVMEGVEAALAGGFDPVKINVVAFRGFNDDEVQAFGEMAKERPLWVRFIEHMPMKHSEMGPFLPEQEILRRLNDIGELMEIPCNHPAETARRFRFKDGTGEIGLISPISHKFCDKCNRLRLNADGTLQGCLLGDVFTDVKGPLRAGAGVEQLAEIMMDAAKNKPVEHSFDVTGFKKCARSMPIVGG